MSVLRMTRGTTKKIVVNLIDKYGKSITPGESDKVIFGVKQYYYSDYSIKKIANASDIVDGKVTFIINPNDTINLDIGRYVYDVGYLKGTEFLMLIEATEFEIKQNITAMKDIGDST